MPKSWAARRLPALVCVISSWAFAQEIHLKTRTIDATTQAAPAAAGAAVKPAVRQRPGARQTIHQIVEFDHPPGAADLSALLGAGATVTGALPDNAVVVAVRGGLNTSLSGVTGVTWIGSLEARDKISPALNPAAHSALAIVEFHSDVSADEQAAVASALNIPFQRPAGLLPQHVIVQATPAMLNALSARDEVAYIFPADPSLLSGAQAYPCAGMLTTAGTIPQYANVTHGWDLGPDNIAHLTYYFGSVTAKVPAATAESEIERAFNAWAAVVNVTFQPSVAASVVRGIYIEFVSGAHGDAYPFDGPGGILAHTFYPVPINAETIAGDMHFDADESWHVGSGVDIYTVALHEAGHALGLSHSDNPGDVMYPYYRFGASLSANDIGAVRELYAPAATTPVTTAPVTTPTPAPPSTPAIAPLTLTLDSVPAATQTDAITVTGITSGGAAPVAIAWQTDHGYSGAASVSPGSDMWTAAGIPLVAGVNTITITAFDCDDRVASATATVTYGQTYGQTGTTPAGPIAISIASPASAVVTVSASSLSVSGKASGGAGITRVAWQTSNGATGIANGIGTWIATGIPLPVGTTTVILRAYDAAGSSAWVALVAVRP